MVVSSILFIFAHEIPVHLSRIGVNYFMQTKVMGQLCLEWYRLLQRPVPQDLIDRLESSPRYLGQAPLTLLRNKVQQYHASLE